MTATRKLTLAQVSAALTAQNEINAATGNPPVGKRHPAHQLNLDAAQLDELADLADRVIFPDEVPAAAKPIPLSKVNPAVLDYFLELRKVAVAESITATAAIHRALDNFPQVTRKDLKHAAAAAGINPLTARNTFDRIRASAK